MERSITCLGRSRYLIIFPALVAIVWSFVSPVSAEPVQGLNTTYYTIDEIPPVQSTTEYPVCGSELENNINRSYDGEPYQDCTNDLFMVHMTGFITIPEHSTIEFWLASDDGGRINIGGNEWGNWGDQGCSWMESGQIDISAGSANLNLFMYENGGASCLMLAWNINNDGWSIVPDEAFTTDYQQPPDTTIPDTTMPETTTTWTTTTTSTIAESTTVPATTPSTTSTPQTTSTNPPETMPPHDSLLRHHQRVNIPAATSDPQKTSSAPSCVGTSFPSQSPRPAGNRFRSPPCRAGSSLSCSSLWPRRPASPRSKVDTSPSADATMLLGPPA